MPDGLFDDLIPTSDNSSSVSQSILQQESGNNDNIQTSIDGAVGPGQITPATFARYAQPGERIDNPDDNRAVHSRIIADLSAKSGGDPARIAVGYFSGDGNIAPPDSPTPWKHDYRDGNGKSVSSYVSDVVTRSTQNKTDAPLYSSAEVTPANQKISNMFSDLIPANSKSSGLFDDLIPKQNIFQNAGSKVAAAASAFGEGIYGNIPIAVSTLADMAGRHLGYTPPDLGIGGFGRARLEESKALSDKLIPDTASNRIVKMAAGFVPGVLGPEVAIPYFVSQGVADAKLQLENEKNTSPQDAQDINVLAKGALNGALAVIPGFKEMPLAAQKGIAGYAARTLTAGGTGLGLGAAISAVNDAIDKYTTDPDKVVGSSALQSGVETGLASLLFHGLVNEPLRGKGPEEQQAQDDVTKPEPNTIPPDDTGPVPPRAAPVGELLPEVERNPYNIYTPDGRQVQSDDLLSSVPQDTPTSVIDPAANQGAKLQQLIKIRQDLEKLDGTKDPQGRVYWGALKAKEAALVKELTPPPVQQPEAIPAQPDVQSPAASTPMPDGTRHPFQDNETLPLGATEREEQVPAPSPAVVDRYKGLVADTAAKAGLPQLNEQQLNDAAMKLAQSHATKVTPSEIEPPVPVQIKAKRQFSAPKTPDLLQFIASHGGIKSDDANIGDVKAMDLHTRFIPGYGKLVRPDGLPLDELRNRAVQAGYLRDASDATGGEATSTVADLLDAMGRNAKGERVFADKDLSKVVNRKAAQDALNQPDYESEEIAKHREDDAYQERMEDDLRQYGSELGLSFKPGTSFDEMNSSIAEREGMMKYQRKSENDKQSVIPGAEQSARQAMQAKENSGRGMIQPKKPQQALDTGLFAEKPTEQKTLFRSQKPIDTVRVTPRADMDLNHDATQKKLSDYVDKVMGNKGYGIKLVQALKDQNGKNVQGAFSPANKMAYIALNGENGIRDFRDLFGTTRHEVIHALRDAGVIPKSDWDILSKKAEEKWLQQFKIAKSYPHADREAMIEEAVAEAAAHRGDIKEGPMVKRALDHIMNFFDKVGRFLKGEALKTARDVLSDVDKGKYAGKEAEVRESKGTKFSYEKVPDSLMGFRKNGPNRGYDAEKYPLHQDLRIKFKGDDTFEDGIKGMNKAHIMERARRNWPGAEIEAIGEPTKINYNESPAVKFQRRQEEEKLIPKNLIDKFEALVGKAVHDTPVERMIDAYKMIVAPETISPKQGKRMDARLAQNNVRVRHASDAIAHFFQGESDKLNKLHGKNIENATWDMLKAHDEGEDKGIHGIAREMLAAQLKMENEAGIPTRELANYFPGLYEKSKKLGNVEDYFVTKFGQDWFTKEKEFKLHEEARAAGFKPKGNFVDMLVSRLMAGQEAINKLQTLKNLESDGLAMRSVVKKDKDGKVIERSLINTAKLPPEEMKAFAENNFRIIGPDSKPWYLDKRTQQLWKNAVDSRGLWENKTAAGDIFRGWQAARNFWVPLKLGLSFFHPAHVATIHAATGIASAFENIAKGGSMKDSLATLGMALKMGFGVEGGVNPFRKFSGGKAEHPAITAWKTPAKDRTQWQADVVKMMEDGAFMPGIAERDKINFRSNLMKAINQKQFQKLALPALQAGMRVAAAPVFEYWIPGLKTEAYLRRAQNAINRDQSLVHEDGRRAEVLRQISKDLDRTYGEMNYDTMFMNKIARDAATASFLSAGWKAAQLYYYKGLLAEPAKFLYNAAKTGKLDPKQMSYNMMFSYTYGTLSLIMGAMFAKMLGGEVNNLTDMIFPQTGEKAPDGTPIRISLPFFNKEAFMLQKDMDVHGLAGGAMHFIADQTLYPQVINTVQGKDYVGRPLMTDMTDLDQLAHTAWNTIKPISFDQLDKAQLKNSEVLKLATLYGSGAAPQYAAQPKFEHQVVAKYFDLNPSKGSVYQRDLQTEYKLALEKDDTDKLAEIDEKLRKTGMTGKQINNLTHEFTTPFMDYAWKKLPAEEQIDLFKSATPDEQEKFWPMMRPEAKQQVRLGQ